MKKIILLMLVSFSAYANDSRLSCDLYRADYERLKHEREVLDKKSHLINMKREEDKRDFVENWVITSELIDINLYFLREHCS